MNNRRKILLIHLFSNGDCLYATAVAKQIKQDEPDCHLTWAIADYCKNILFNNPYIDELMIIKDINPKNWPKHWKGFQAEVKKLVLEKRIDEVVFTQIVERNFANYDYCLRSSTFRGYAKPVTVSVQPVLRLTTAEIQRAEEFAARHKLAEYKNVLLLEFSPQSGQARFTPEMALSLSRRVTQNGMVAVVLSSSSLTFKDEHPAIIDGSALSLREIAHLTKYCTLLIGCSSGTTWISTSDAAKQLPMVQVLNPKSYWFNSVVNDHKRFGLGVDHIIEMDDANMGKFFECVEEVLSEDFLSARNKYHQEWPMRFRVTRGILSYLLGKGDIKDAIKHVRINLALFGWKRGLLKSIFLGITTFPIFNLKNKIRQMRNGDLV